MFIFLVHSISTGCSLASVGQEILAFAFYSVQNPKFPGHSSLWKPPGSASSVHSDSCIRRSRTCWVAVFLQTCAPDLKEAASLLWPFIIYKALQVYTAFYETQRQGPALCAERFDPAFHLSELSCGNARQAGLEGLRAVSGTSAWKEGFLMRNFKRGKSGV